VKERVLNINVLTVEEIHCRGSEVPVCACAGGGGRFVVCACVGVRGEY